MANVLLVGMPFFSVRYPAVGISLLKPRLRQSGFDADIRYFNVPFAERIGVQRYDEICNTHVQSAMVGEWLFAQAHFGGVLPPASRYIEHLAPYFHSTTLTPDDLLEIRDLIPAFLQDCLDAVPWSGYDIVGFSTSCEQTMPSVALAALVKQRYPEVPIVFGGANCEGEMGLEMHRAFPCIDYVCSGEADNSFPELVRRVLARRPADDIPGVIARVDGESRTRGEGPPIRDLDALPYPDYDDYFAALDRSPLTRATNAGVPLETSRGCWWGERHHCTFCGLKDSTMVFRSKSQRRAIDEIRFMVERYHPAQIQVVDNIVDLKYFQTLMPELKQLQLPVQIFYESKANLSKAQVRSLAEAGVTWLQPGIESLNSHVLHLIDKGVTGLQNIQLLKWCKELGVYPTWNLLTGFPGETDEDYGQLLSVMAQLHHLDPPEGFANFALYRFAPYFTNAARYGLQNVRPEKTYRFIYPFDDPVLLNLGYYLEFDYAEAVKPSFACADELAAAVDVWKRTSAEGGAYLYCWHRTRHDCVIEDRRDGASARYVFSGIQKFIYACCDRVRGFEAVYQEARQAFPDLPLRRRDVRDFLNDLVALGLMLEENDKYLSLAVCVGGDSTEHDERASDSREQAFASVRR